MIRRYAVLPCAIAATCVCAAWLSARASAIPPVPALAVVAPALLIAIARMRFPARRATRVDPVAALRRE